MIKQEENTATTSHAAQEGALTSAASQPEHAAWNFVAFSWYHVLMRTGWIFKTESLVMPVVLDTINGSAWLRGFLPMLNRFGQSIPPLATATHLRNARFKKVWLIGSSGMMGLVFLCMACAWLYLDQVSTYWMSALVLGLYAIFFVSTGINQLVISSLQGKLIPVLRRGELLQWSSLLGSAVAIICAWFLLRRWMGTQPANFAAIFAFAGALFVAGAIAALLLQETEDSFAHQRFSLLGIVADTTMTLRGDASFRRVALTASLFGMMMTLFPHYQAVARERLHLGLGSLVPWIIAQNLGVALFSWPVGRITDRVGNRLALRLLMGGLCIVPLLALSITWIPAVSEHWFLAVFAMLGLTPVTMRAFANYTIEMTDRSNQPRYLAILSLFMAGPAILASVLIGLLIDQWGYEFTFGVVTSCQIGGFLMTYRLAEPRLKLGAHDPH